MQSPPDGAHVSRRDDQNPLGNERNCFEQSLTDELAIFETALKAARNSPPDIVSTITILTHTYPMDVLRNGASALAALETNTFENSAKARNAKEVRLYSPALETDLTCTAISNRNRMPAANPLLLRSDILMRLHFTLDRNRRSTCLQA